MSTSVDSQALHSRDLIALPNGSVYEVSSRQADEPAVRVRLWCAHDPEPIAFAPPLVDLQAEQTVQLLSKAETREHLGHPGFVRTAFEQEMTRHHQEKMMGVYERFNREDAARGLRERAARPWWKKLFTRNA